MVRLQLALNVRDGMCFTTSSGSICKDGSIISIQYAVQQVLGRGLVNIALRDILVKHLVESESMILALFEVGPAFLENRCTCLSSGGSKILEFINNRITTKP